MRRRSGPPARPWRSSGGRNPSGVASDAAAWAPPAPRSPRFRARSGKDRVQPGAGFAQRATAMLARVRAARFIVMAPSRSAMARLSSRTCCRARSSDGAQHVSRRQNAPRNRSPTPRALVARARTAIRRAAPAARLPIAADCRRSPAARRHSRGRRACATNRSMAACQAPDAARSGDVQRAGPVLAYRQDIQEATDLEHLVHGAAPDTHRIRTIPVHEPSGRPPAPRAVALEI